MRYFSCLKQRKFELTLWRSLNRRLVRPSKFFTYIFVNYKLVLHWAAFHRVPSIYWCQNNFVAPLVQLWKAASMNYLDTRTKSIYYSSSSFCRRTSFLAFLWPLATLNRKLPETIVIKSINNSNTVKSLSQ